MRALRSFMVAASVLALVPYLVIFLTLALATLLGCDVNENGPQACEAFGADWGWLLSGMLSAGWLGLLTIPVLMVLFLVWLAAEALAWRRRRRLARRLAREELAA